jgi:hypothetical protein
VRDDIEKLRGCPVCGTRVTDVNIGLRDFRWVNQHLPKRVGMMDIDGLLERKGNVLALELKPPGASISVGARMTFRTLVRMGMDIWVVWQKTPTVVEVGEVDWSGEIGEVTQMSVTVLAGLIAEWYDHADANPQRFRRPS